MTDLRCNSKEWPEGGAHTAAKRHTRINLNIKVQRKNSGYIFKHNSIYFNINQDFTIM